MKLPTRVNHPPDVPVPPDNHPVVAPIHQTVKFDFDSVDETLRYLRREREGFFYQRDSNPTTRQLELTLAEMQGREDCIVCGSGVAAINVALASLTEQGDHVLCFVESYGPTRQMIQRFLAKFGVRHTMLSIEDAAGVERLLAGTRTRLMIFESPTNPANKIADLATLTRLARAHGVLTLMDNTFAGPHQHGQFDIDVFLHSLTKFAAGHGDVMGGAVIANAKLIERMKRDFILFGGVLDPHAAFLIQRGLKTYFVRYRAQCANAQRIAELLEKHPAVENVRYPGLASHGQHLLARAQMSEFGAVVTFDLKAGAEAGQRFAEALELFAITASLGATDSLVIPPQLMGGREFNAEQRRASGIAAGTIRLSIGLEDIDDLLADISQALVAANVGVVSGP